MVYIHNKPRSAQRKHFVRKEETDNNKASAGITNKLMFVHNAHMGIVLHAGQLCRPPPPGRHKWMESPASVMEVPSSEWILLLLLLMMDSGCCRWLILLAAGNGCPYRGHQWRWSGHRPVSAWIHTRTHLQPQRLRSGRLDGARIGVCVCVCVCIWCAFGRTVQNCLT
ncbi:uncharacterized protein LOC121404635 isoform X1 [Drosophila obscura]|uniref:uncharacterized protein LOC121404635 isoform X1 n=1 Tax=Drosophila obscura TaxID=7282 RepID=UPI001BB1346A|nr:uncharacterized protein LOC121404635 isoform X1 [Drosophila obscura]